jgi:hypothetical protein
MTNAEFACLTHCPYGPEDQIEHLPTTTELDPQPALRPWIEWIGGEGNLSGFDMSFVDMIPCYVPQGIRGCGFESPLESMYKALVRAQTQGEDQYGFLRDGAMLAVVLVTDEVDCSVPAEQSTIFDTEGARTFWSDPDAAFPTSAVCWNAGVECEGGPGEYDNCVPAYYDGLGNPVAPDDAVMFPVDRYVSLLQGFQREGRPVAVYGLFGSIHYADSPDPGFQEDFGIGASCTSDGITALPPVRQRELVEAFGDSQNMFTICAGDYGLYAEVIADDIRSHFE